MIRKLPNNDNEVDFINYIEAKYNYYLLKIGMFEKELPDLKNEHLRVFLCMDPMWGGFRVMFKKLGENKIYGHHISLVSMAEAIKHDKELYTKFVENVKRVFEGK